MANIKILPYADQDAALQRQAKLAQLLQEQGSTPQEQQMVSGYVIPNSPLIGLSKMLQTYMGKKKERDVTTKQAELKKQAQSEADSWLERISNAQDPTLAYRETPIMENASDEDRTELQPKMVQQDTDEQRGDMVPAMQRTPFVKPGMSDKEMNLELMRAMSSGNPMLQNAAQMYASLRPKATPVEYGTEPRYDQNGNAFLVGKNGSILPISGISKPADKAVSQSEFDKQWSIFKQEHPNGTIEQFKRLGASPQSVVNVNTGPTSKYSEDVSKSLADREDAIISAGESAPERVATSHRIKSLLDQSPITGAGAEFQLGVKKLLVAAGMADPNDSEITVTENLISELARGTLDNIKTSGLGGGNGFTDKDREFLEKASLGKVALNSNTLKYLADKNEQAARQSIIKANAIKDRRRQMPEFSGIPGAFDPTPIPAEYSGQSNFGAAPAGAVRRR